jgi:acetate kinase
MTKLVLAVNAGSSSVKVSVFSLPDGPSTADPKPRQLAEAQISGLTAPPPKLSYSRGQTAVHKGDEADLAAPASQQAAFALLLKTLRADAALAFPSDDDDDAASLVVAHRVVHGGDATRPTERITPAVLARLEGQASLAPLHNGPALAIVRACLGEGGGRKGLLPGASHVAVFDSAFHASLPAHVRAYPIDQAVARKRGLRKYGFHGISYAFVVRAVAGFLGKPAAQTNVIALHLGSGASACAVRGGKSVDTSMGLTPLSGLPGATRSGSVDPRYALL